MLLGLKIVLLALSAGLGVQDLLEYRVYVFWFPCMAVCGLVLQFFELGGYATVLYILFNLLMLLFALAVAYWVARRKGLLFINHSMGLGDILMLAVLGLSCAPLYFLSLWLCSSLLALLIHPLVFQRKIIPYAGYLGICWAALLLFELINPSILQSLENQWVN